MLGFRSLFRTHDTPELIDITQVQLAAWLKHKRYDSSLHLGPEPIEISRGVRGRMQHHADEAGSRTMRARIVENTTSGTWTSELTVHNSPTGNRGWVWLDRHRPDSHAWTSTPRLFLPGVDIGNALDAERHRSGHRAPAPSSITPTSSRLRPAGGSDYGRPQ